MAADADPVHRSAAGRAAAVVEELRARTDPAALAGMARFGIDVSDAFGGTSLPALRAMATGLRPDHDLALALWDTGVHEARMLAALVDDPGQVTRDQMERWASGFSSWDVVDGCCMSLFDKTPFAWTTAVEWSAREEEYVKRAGFALMASLAVHDKRADDDRFEALLPVIEREAGDRRNFVRKAVNWALREIGKRNLALNAAAVAAARRILAASPHGRNWVASNTIRELTGNAVQERLRRVRARPRPPG